MAKFAIDEPQLRNALDRLFHGKCAFCERFVQTFPYRFRPTEEAGPVSSAPTDDANQAHLYYSWLTNAWRNIYSICSDCMPKESSLFPVRKERVRLPQVEDLNRYINEPIGDWPGEIKEKPLLIDPCEKGDLRKHLLLDMNGQLFACSERGDATVRHFNLNRESLQIARSAQIEIYFSDLASGNSIANCLEFESKEFGGCWYLMVYQLARVLCADTGEHPSLTPRNIFHYFEKQAASTNFYRRLRSAFANLRAGPPIQEVRSSWPDSSGTAMPIRFKINNFKAIEAIEVILVKEFTPITQTDGTSLAPALIILGENAAGKSSVLEAMALALSGPNVSGVSTDQWKNFMLDPMQMGAASESAPRNGEITVTCDDGIVYQLSFGSAGATYERLGLNSEENERNIGPRIPVFAYGAQRMFLGGDRVIKPSDAIKSLLSPRHVLANPEKWLISIYGTPRFDEVIRALRSILAIGQTFHTIEVDTVQQRCLLVIKGTHSNGSEFFSKTPLATVSSGFRSVLGMACDVMRRLFAVQNRYSAALAKTYAVVIIDEIEAHLHPRWKMRIMRGLREALPNVVFIATTHDPLCLRGMTRGEVRILRRVQNEQADELGIPTKVEITMNLQPIEALTIEQLLTSDLFQLFTTDDVSLEASLSGVGELLVRASIGLINQTESSQLQRIRQRIHQDILESLPIGSTEVQRIVQEAVERYLRGLAQRSGDSIVRLREETRNSIILALGAL